MDAEYAVLLYLFHLYSFSYIYKSEAECVYGWNRQYDSSCEYDHLFYTISTYNHIFQDAAS